MEDETGKDRVRSLFKRRCIFYVYIFSAENKVIRSAWYSICVDACVCRPGDNVVLEEVREFQVTVLVATLTGFLLGGLVGARYAGDKFVAISHSAKFSSTMQAQVAIQQFSCKVEHVLNMAGNPTGGAHSCLPLYYFLLCVCVIARATQCITFGIHQEWMSLGVEVRSLFCNVQVINRACRYSFIFDCIIALQWNTYSYVNISRQK